MSATRRPRQPDVYARREQVRTIIESIYGPPRWAGMNAKVWPFETFVLKLEVMSLDQTTNLRTLKDRQGPYARILSIDTDDEHNDEWRTVVVTILERVYGDVDRSGYPRTFSSRDWPPDVWTDETGQAWQQFDAHSGNTVGGKWIDLTSIYPKPRF